MPLTPKKRINLLNLLLAKRFGERFQRVPHSVDFGLKSLISAVAILLSLSSCHLLKASAINHSDRIKMKEAGNCPVDVRQSLKDFAAGTATANQIETSLDCITRDIDQFQLRTQSSTSKDTYSLKEMTAFFTKYFAGTPEFNESNLTAYLKFKNFLLGGSENLISKSEIGIIEKFLGELKPILVDMAPYMSIYKLQKPLNLDEPEDSAQLTKAIKGVHELVQVINKYFPGQKGAVFQFTDLDRLDFAQSSSGSTKLSDSEAVQLIMSLKSVVVKPPEDRVHGEEFPRFMSQLDLMLESALRLKYIRELKQNQDDVFVKNLQLFKGSILPLFHQAFLFQSAGGIPSVELIKLLKKLDRYQLIPYGLKEKSVENFLPTLITKVLAKTPAKTIPSIAEIHFTGENVDTLANSLDEWISIQGIFLDAIGNRNEIQASELIEKFEQATKSLGSSKFGNAYLQMLEVLSNGTLLRWKDNEVLNFAPRRNDQSFTRYDLVFLSTSFSIMRKIMRSYIMDPTRRSNVSAMNEDELMDLYNSVREMGKDLKFIDTRNRLAPSRAFLENNIFTSVSNGDDLVQFHEAIEWLYQVWSAGNMGQKIYRLVPDKCKTADLDVFDHHRLNHECYTQFFKEHAREFFQNLPTVSVYINELLTQNPAPPTNRPKQTSKDPWGDFEVTLENSFRPEGYSDYDFDSPDTEATALILSYTESIFINHSHAYNGELDTSDVWNTYPIMRGFIEKVSNGEAKTEFIKKAAYSYLITFGEVPSADGLLNLVKFGGWSVLRDFHKEIAYTGDLFRVISTFSLSSKAGKIKNIEAYVKLHQDTLESDVRSKKASTIEDLKQLLFCNDEITDYLTSTLATNADQIFSKTPAFNPTIFHQRVEKMITSNQKLALECLPFEYITNE